MRRFRHRCRRFAEVPGETRSKLGWKGSYTSLSYHPRPRVGAFVHRNAGTVYCEL